ncbi:MFS polyamine transporter [Infundibulicybe gibba]|nr:MFS polyamine transporter [Infundibulicybe gibba]
MPHPTLESPIPQATSMPVARTETINDSSDSKLEGLDITNTIWIDWDGPDDPQNPRNWDSQRKWAATLVVSSFTFISPVASSMIAPASGNVAHEFGIITSSIVAMTTSIFLLGYAVGPLVLGPLSEIYGRPRVLQLSNVFFLAWNIACGFAKSKNQLILFRFLAGIGGSAPFSIGGGVLGDIWRPEERGRAIGIYNLAPLLGPVIGPVCGAWISHRTTWRWVFWSTSIFDVVLQVLGFIFLQETYAPVLLERKASRMMKSINAETGHANTTHVRTIYDQKACRHWKSIFSKALTRPFLLFLREPIIQLFGLYLAFVYGLFYLFLTTIPGIFSQIYHQPAEIGGLNYIALGIGLMIASQVNVRFMDRVYIHFKEKNNGVGEPEFRLPPMIPGTIFLPIGLLISGWAAQTHLPWIVTDLGMALVGVGIVLNFQSIQAYTVDAFTLHSASALAATTCLRSFAGFGFPILAPAMYSAVGYGKGNTILAAAAVVIGCPTPWLFWKYGKHIRSHSKYAHKHQATRGDQ